MFELLLTQSDDFFFNPVVIDQLYPDLLEKFPDVTSRGIVHYGWIVNGRIRHQIEARIGKPFFILTRGSPANLTRLKHFNPFTEETENLLPYGFSRDPNTLERWNKIDQIETFSDLYDLHHALYSFQGS